LRVVAWNLERGAHLGVWTAQPALREADLLLLTELDVGMARTSNRHVPAEIARELGLAFAFVPLFRELTRGNRRERRETRGMQNSEALHGLGIFSRLPIRSARALALPAVYDWTRNVESREGGRAALIVELETPSQEPLHVVCTHLECHTEPPGRALQLAAALDALPEGPCILGGDFNSSTAHHSSLTSIARLALRLAVRPGRLADPVAEEPLFEHLARAGFSHREAMAPGTGTGTPHGLGLWPRSLRFRVDWIVLRGLEAVPGSAAVFPAPRVGRRLSVHDGVGVEVRLE
jgi:endonuclease/exonuclease/phosphatase family metal-dependent hydrolase